MADQGAEEWKLTPALRWTELVLLEPVIAKMPQRPSLL
jgi:hypothetical protein